MRSSSVSGSIFLGFSADRPHPVTRRGNARQTAFESDADRLVYLDLLRTNCQILRLSLAGYCLMSNHVHLIVAWLEMKPFSDAWDAARWRECLSRAGAVEEADAIRKSTHSGRPLGTPDFVAQLEKALRRRLAPQKGGRPPSEQADERLMPLIFPRGVKRW